MFIHNSTDHNLAKLTILLENKNVMDSLYVPSFINVSGEQAYMNLQFQTFLNPCLTWLPNIPLFAVPAIKVSRTEQWEWMVLQKYCYDFFPKINPQRGKKILYSFNTNKMKWEIMIIGYIIFSDIM